MEDDLGQEKVEIVTKTMINEAGIVRNDDDDEQVCRMIKAKWPKGRKNPAKKRSLLALL